MTQSDWAFIKTSTFYITSIAWKLKWDRWKYSKGLGYGVPAIAFFVIVSVRNKFIALLDSLIFFNTLLYQSNAVLSENKEEIFKLTWANSYRWLKYFFYRNRLLILPDIPQWINNIFPEESFLLFNLQNEVNVICQKKLTIGSQLTVNCQVVVYFSLQSILHVL